MIYSQDKFKVSILTVLKFKPDNHANYNMQKSQGGIVLVFRGKVNHLFRSKVNHSFRGKVNHSFRSKVNHFFEDDLTSIFGFKNPIWQIKLFLCLWFSPKLTDF